MKKRKALGVKQAVYVSDIHVPYHDKNDAKTLRHFLKQQQPDYLIFGGDIVDFYSVSRFDKDPERRFDLQDEVTQGIIYMQSMLSAAGPQAKGYFLEGNHENRMMKYLRRNPEIASLNALTIPSLMNLKQLGLHFTPYDKGLVKHGFLFKHGTRANMHTAKAEVDLENISGMSGHIHRVQQFSKTDRNGQHVWHTVGHMSDDSEIDYMNNQVPNWQHGFGVVEWKLKQGTRQVYQPVLQDSKFQFDGLLYTPRGVK